MLHLRPPFGTATIFSQSFLRQATKTTGLPRNKSKFPKSVRRVHNQDNDKIRLRLAREDDFKNVLHLSQSLINNANDCIPIVFHEWLKTQNKLFFMAELQGKCVGHSVANIVSHGKTFFVQSLRLHPEFRGQRLSYHMILSVMDYVRHIHPKVSKNHTIASTREMFSIAKRLGERITMKLNFHNFGIKGDAEFLPKISSRSQMLREQGLGLYSYDTSDAAHIVTSADSILNSIAPQKMMFRHTEPYQALPSNAKFLFKENDKMFADVSAQEIKEGKIPRSFSHGWLSPRVRSVFWACVVYANDLHSFRTHVLRQLETATEIIRNDFVFSVLVYSKISSFDETRLLEEELRSLKQNSDVKGDTAYVFESIYDTK